MEGGRYIGVDVGARGVHTTSDRSWHDMCGNSSSFKSEKSLSSLDTYIIQVSRCVRIVHLRIVFFSLKGIYGRPEKHIVCSSVKSVLC